MACWDEPGAMNCDMLFALWLLLYDVVMMLDLLFGLLLLLVVILLVLLLMLLPLPAAC